MTCLRSYAPYLLVLAVGWAFSTSAVAQDLQTVEFGACPLESGETLAPCTVGYRTLGALNADRSNAILVPTWYGGNSEGVAAVFGGIVDTTAFFVIVVDAFGNGVSTSPSHSAAQGGATPQVTIGDMVTSQHRLVTEVLGLDHLHAVVGVSMGGMQTFEWLVAHPTFMDKAVPIIGSPRLGAYDRTLWETQLRLFDQIDACQCIEAAAALAGVGTLVGTSPEWVNANRDSLDAGASMMEEARAMLDRPEGWTKDMASQARAMIAHDISRRFGGDMDAAAEAIQADVLSVVVRADHVVTPGTSIDIVGMMGGESIVLDDPAGHSATGSLVGAFESRVQSFLEGTTGNETISSDGEPDGAG